MQLQEKRLKKLEKCPIGNHGNNKNGRTPGAVSQLWLVIAFG